MPSIKGKVFLWVGGVNPSTFRITDRVFDNLFAQNDIGLLQSYAVMRAPFLKGKVNEIKERWFRGHRVMADSGAFSVATSTHGKIDVYEYMDFMATFKDCCEVFITLDVVTDVNASVRNYDLIRSKGFPVMPVYHIGEPISLLDDYVKDTGWVGIGGSVVNNISGEKQRTCYNKIFCKGDDWRYPPFTLHGLGVSGYKLSFDYPWKSVDNSRAQKFGGYGSLFNPNFFGLYVSDWGFYKAYKEEITSHPLIPWTEAELKTGPGSSVRRFVYNVAIQREAYIKEREFSMDQMKPDFLDEE